MVPAKTPPACSRRYELTNGEQVENEQTVAPPSCTGELSSETSRPSKEASELSKETSELPREVGG